MLGGDSWSGADMLLDVEEEAEEDEKECSLSRGDTIVLYILIGIRPEKVSSSIDTDTGLESSSPQQAF